MKPIPVSAGKKIAQEFDYDQVVVVARKVGLNGGEHVTTYGRNPEHCEIAARVGDFLKYEIMKWERAIHPPAFNPVTDELLEAVRNWKERPAPVNAALVLKVAERWAGAT